MARALFVELTCSDTGRPAVARFDWSGEAWELRSATPYERGGAKPPADGRPPRQGQFNLAPDYPGCPSCGADSFVKCNGCQNLGCWRYGTPMFTCPTCHSTGRVQGTIDSLNPLDEG